MGQRVLLKTTTAAIEDPDAGAFRISSALHRECAPVLAIAPIAGDEEVCLWFDAGGTWVPVEAPSNDGTQVKFTASYAADIVNGAGRFAITKTSTASALTVTIQDGRE